MLSEKQLPGRVDYTREGQQQGGDFKSVVYKAEEVSIRIRNVEFPGATPDQAAFLANAAHRLADADYLRSSLGVVARMDLLPLFLQRGYLKAEFAPSDAKVIPAADPSTPTELQVDALLPVTPGKQFMVSTVDWKGTSVVTAEEAASLFHLTAAKPADAVRLALDSERLIKLYHSRGYMTAQLKPDPQMDDEKATVHYDMNVTEGDLYNMGELEILGLDTKSHDLLREAWKLREGQPYNADYTKKFLDDSSPLLPRGAQYSIKLSEDLQAQDKTVDVTIHFKMQ
jgi:outer membrane translocation and assembly module TamA